MCWESKRPCRVWTPSGSTNRLFGPEGTSRVVGEEKEDDSGRRDTVKDDPRVL